MKKIIKLSESDLEKIIRKVLKEQIAQGGTNDPWEYKKEGDNYFTRKKGSTNWVLTSGKPKEAIMSKIFGIKSNNEPVNDPSKTTPKKPVNNDNIIVSDYVNPVFKRQINFNKLSTTDTTHKICTPNDKECGQFVNDYSDKLKNVGNAWLAHDTDSVGERIYSIYTKVDDKEKKQYQTLWSKLLNGTISIDEIKNFNQQLLNRYGINSPKLQVDDVVGIFYPNSKNHIKAFGESGKPYFVNGKAGKTLQGGRGFSFNTHVGIVGAIKNGIPLIFHNVDGDVRSDPANKLQITWVKRS